MKVIVLSLILVVTTRVESYRVRTKKSNENVQDFLMYASGFEKNFTKEYFQLKRTGIQSDQYVKMLDIIKPSSNLLRRNEIEEETDQRFDVTCLMCRAVVNTILNFRRKEGYNDEQLIEEAIDLCVSLNIQPDVVCEQIINIHIVSILYIADRRPNLNAKNICGFVLQASKCGTSTSSFDYEIVVDKKENFAVDEEETDSSEENYRVLQITDIHYDPRYTPGSNAVCEEPLCCRQMELEEPEDAAGYWGDYRNCDAPWHAVIEALQHINETHEKFDWIYYTGDIIDHGVWETSMEGNLEIIEKITQLLKDSFPNTPLLPILGNHETHPVNVFAPTTIIHTALTTNWLYKYSADAWLHWLPKHTKSTIVQGGYYTVLVTPKLRVVALNNNECYVYNWWTFYTTQSQIEQLQWFHDILLQAESNNESVHILAHIPSGEGSCHKIWSREYRKIVERFRKTIKAQFYGHTHFDEFNIFYKRSNPDVPVSVGFNGGSLSPYVDVNPNYKIYSIGKKTLMVNDFESWSYNLTEANLTPNERPKWRQTYSFREEFDLQNLTLNSLDDLVRRFTSDTSLLHKYWRYKVKHGDPFINAECHKNCLTNALCEIVTNETGDDQKCEYLMELMSINSAMNAFKEEKRR